MRTLIVGKNSFIGRSFFHSTKNVDIVSYSDLDNVNFSKYTSVLNCAIKPEYKLESYKRSNDLDYQVASLAQKHNCHYIMMSTRKVYGTSDDLQILIEDSSISPTDRYGENKARTEDLIMHMGLENVTILRASNIYGFEYGRNSFMGFCMNQLKDTDKIVYSISPETKRDFISIKSVCKVLNRVVQQKPHGIYNLSSGYGVPIGDVARSLIEGYESGEFSSSGPIKDQFILDNKKLLNKLCIELPIFQTKYIKKLGEKL